MKEPIDTGTTTGGESILPDGFGMPTGEPALPEVVKNTPEVLQHLGRVAMRHRGELKKAREEAYQEGMKDCLRDAAELHENILRLGVVISDKALRGESLSKWEQGMLSTAQQSAKEVADRGVGKAKTTHEEHKTVSVLGMILDARQERIEE